MFTPLNFSKKTSEANLTGALITACPVKFFEEKEYNGFNRG
jgi:hypothetical protein